MGVILTRCQGAAGNRSDPGPAEEIGGCVRFDSSAELGEARCSYFVELYEQLDARQENAEDSKENSWRSEMFDFLHKAQKCLHSETLT